MAETLLDNYPVSGLGSITTVAENAGVSTPTVARMVQKLGFRGFPDFQARLHQELEATISNPISKHDRWAANAPGTHILNRFADATMNNLRATLAQMETHDFDGAAALIADPKRRICLIGGRITRTLADYLFTHLQVIRAGVTLIPSGSSPWPHYVLDMKKGDVLVVFDIRRYEQELETLAKAARLRGAEIILFTDQWASPIAKDGPAGLSRPYRGAIGLGQFRGYPLHRRGADRGRSEFDLGRNAGSDEGTRKSVRHDAAVSKAVSGQKRMTKPYTMTKKHKNKDLIRRTDSVSSTATVI